MKTIIALCLLLTSIALAAPPPPILRNWATTNAAPKGRVLGISAADPTKQTLDSGFMGLFDDTAGNKVSLDWGARQMFDGANKKALDYNTGNRLLYDTTETTSLDWRSRTLNNAAGVSVLDWSGPVVAGVAGVYSGYWTNITGGTSQATQDVFTVVAPGIYTVNCYIITVGALGANGSVAVDEEWVDQRGTGVNVGTVNANVSAVTRGAAQKIPIALLNGSKFRIGVTSTGANYVYDVWWSVVRLQ